MYSIIFILKYTLQESSIFYHPLAKGAASLVSKKNTPSRSFDDSPPITPDPKPGAQVLPVIAP